MEILLAILMFLLHCFTAFAFIYSYDKSDIKLDIENGENATIKMPKLEDLQEEELLIVSENDSVDEIARKQRANEGINRRNKEQRQKYIDDVINPAIRYFSLRKDIEYCQSKYRGVFSPILVQLFSLLCCSQMLIRTYPLDSWIFIILVVAAICTVSSLIIYWIYKNKCHNIRMGGYEFIGYELPRDSNHIICNHIEFLYSIKETVWFRYSIRKIFYGVSSIIFLLFLPMPD